MLENEQLLSKIMGDDDAIDEEEDDDGNWLVFVIKITFSLVLVLASFLTFF